MDYLKFKISHQNIAHEQFLPIILRTFARLIIDLVQFTFAWTNVYIQYSTHKSKTNIIFNNET